MVPLIVAAAAVGAALLVPKKQGDVSQSVAQTPNDSAIGVNTGFATPTVQSGLVAPVPDSVTKNSPGSSSSGVPEFSAQAQEFQPAAAHPAPGLYFGPTFYETGQALTLRSKIQAASNPTITDSSKPGGCGCKGGGQSSGGIGGLAPARAAQTAPAGLIAKWAANLSSIPVNPFAAGQQTTFDHQMAVAPVGPAATVSHEDGSPSSAPSSPFNTPIGLTASNLYGHY